MIQASPVALESVESQTAKCESVAPLPAPLSPECSVGWVRRAIRDEDILLFLLGVRWVSLLPPSLSLLLRDNRAAATSYAPYIFGIAVICNIGLSTGHSVANRLLGHRPWLICIDLAMVAIFLAATGGTVSPYTLYAYTPLLAAAYFFGIRGSLRAALALTTFYLAALFAAPPAREFSMADALSQILAFFLIALMFGYPSVLLQRLRAANGQLQRAQEDVQRATTLAALGKTVAHVSHEIRNPLVTLGGFARQLMRQPGEEEMVRHHSKVMAEEITRLENLLTDVLAVARPPKLKLTRGNLHEVLDQACLLAGGAGAGRVTIEKNYAPELPRLSINPPALLRAFLNIARNAVQVMPEGGVLRVATRYDAERDLVEVIITDSGPGIPDHILATIFEPFVTHREHGTGLGLAIAHQIVHEHSGTIKAGNSPAGGAQFTIHLPLMPGENEESQ